MALNINDPSGDLFAELVRLVEELTLLESTLEPATPFDRASSRAQRKLVRPSPQSHGELVVVWSRI